MNELTDAFTTLAKVSTLLVLWYLIGSVFTIGFGIYKYFRALSELDKYNDLIAEVKAQRQQQGPYPGDDDRAN